MPKKIDFIVPTVLTMSSVISMSFKTRRESIEVPELRVLIFMMFDCAPVSNINAVGPNNDDDESSTVRMSPAEDLRT